jgi:hypothetical protein
MKSYAIRFLTKYRDGTKGEALRVFDFKDNTSPEQAYSQAKKRILTETWMGDKKYASVSITDMQPIE